MVQMRVLGGAVVLAEDGQVTGRAAQRHHLALLAFLAASPGGSATRDRLIAHLWPESETVRARHRLSVALHVLRVGLGEGSLVTSGDTVALNRERVRSDVAAYSDAVREGRLEEAVALYSGAFLEGFHLSGSPEFEAWMEGERERLAGLYRSALERLIAEEEASGRLGAAADWWRRLAAHDPFSAPVAAGLMRALARTGDLEGALRHARAYGALVESELGIPPDPGVEALAAEIVQAAAARRPPEGTAAAPSRPAPPGERLAGEEAIPDPTAAPPAPPPPATDPTSGLDPPAGPSNPRRRLVHAGATLVPLAVVAATLAVWLAGRDPGLAAPAAPAATRPSVVVLPFLPSDSGPDGELARGLSSDLAATLALVPGLRVEQPSEAPRPGRPGDPLQAGREAGARHVLDGSLRREDRGLIVEARVLDVGTGEQAWSGRWERPVADPAALREELSLVIADAVRLEVAPFEPNVYTENQRAYDRFLRGVYAHRRFTEEDLWTALQFYREAYEEDPGFALAHAIAGNAYIHLTLLGVSPRVSFERAREHALRSLALDSTLAEGHAALGYLQVFRDRDFEAGARSLRRAIMIYPTLPQARDWYGRYLIYVRDHPEAGLASIRKALEVDPLNTARSQLVEWMLYRTRRYDEIEEQNRVTRSLDPAVAASLAGSPLAEGYRELGRYEEAVRELLALHERRREPPSSELAVTYARMGREAEARAILRDVEGRAERGEADPLLVARVYANLDEADRAFQWLERTFQERPDRILTIRADPALDPLHGDPRFERLLARLGLF